MIVDKKKSYSLQNCSIDWSTVHQSIARYQLLTNDLIFIGSISHMILTSQCRGVVHIIELDGRGYWKHFMDPLFTQWKDWIRKFWKKWRCITKQLKTDFLNNSTVTLSLRLQATDLSSGQIKLLLSLNPVNTVYCKRSQLQALQTIKYNKIYCRRCHIYRPCKKIKYTVDVHGMLKIVIIIHHHFFFQYKPNIINVQYFDY